MRVHAATPGHTPNLIFAGGPGRLTVLELTGNPDQGDPSHDAISAYSSYLQGKIVMSWR